MAPDYEHRPACGFPGDAGIGLGCPYDRGDVSLRPLADEGGHRYWPEPVDEPVEEQQEDDEAEDVPVAIWIARTVTVTRPARQ